jgi:hypothetical protein
VVANAAQASHKHMLCHLPKIIKIAQETFKIELKENSNVPT